MSFLSKIAFFGKWLATPIASIQATAQQARESSGRVAELVNELRQRNAGRARSDDGPVSPIDFQGYVEYYGLTEADLEAVERKYRLAWRVYQFAGMAAFVSALLMLMRGESVAAIGMFGFSVIAGSVALKMRHKHEQVEGRKLISFAAFCKAGGIKKTLFE